MKRISGRIAAAIAVVTLLTSCFAAKSSMKSALTYGNIVGQILKVLMNQYSTHHTLNLADPEVLDNVAILADNLQELKDNSSSKRYLAKFAEGIVSGSGSTISPSTAKEVTNILSELAQGNSLQVLTDKSSSALAKVKEAGAVANSLNLIMKKLQ